MKKGFTATQLKLIAICAMVIDHMAWGFVELNSPLGQIMHVIGRLAIPIMCYFVAEGFRKTHSIRHYILRMLTFAVVAVVPFYLYFNEGYMYRQNFIFDLLLALLALTVTENVNFKKSLKVILVIGICIVSLTIGGWPVFPIALVFIFYYVRDFKKQCLLVTGSVLIVEAAIIPMLILNNTYHFTPLTTEWYDFLYFLGFVLALPLIKLYNGEKGKYPFGKYFFYLFYICHFLVLWGIERIVAGDLYSVYVGAHVLCFVLSILSTYRFTQSKLSKPIVPAIVMSISGCVYIFGFLMEITAGDTLDIAYAGTVVQYFGESVLFVAFLWFMSEFCKIRLHQFVYVIAGFFSLLTICLVLTTRENYIFYENMFIDKSGPFNRLNLTYGIGFYVFFTYMILFYITIFYMCYKALRRSSKKERKRIYWLLAAFASPMLMFLIKMTGITGGYEIIAVGLILSFTCIDRAIFKFGYFDSVQAAGETVLYELGEGVLVTDSDFRATYFNKFLAELFPGLENGIDVHDVPGIGSLLLKKKYVFKRDKKSFESDMQEVIEKETMHGYILTVRDMTEHYEYMMSLEREARLDPLTGTFNRLFFRELTENYLGEGGHGCFMMLDLDEFKGVNDSFGHDTGDRVLKLLSQLLMEKTEGGDFAGRQGGDEFTLFFKDITDATEIHAIGESLILEFRNRLSREIPECVTSLSIGAVIIDGKLSGTKRECYIDVYKRADKIMYAVKNKGKSGIEVVKF